MNPQLVLLVVLATGTLCSTPADLSGQQAYAPSMFWDLVRWNPQLTLDGKPAHSSSVSFGLAAFDQRRAFEIPTALPLDASAFSNPNEPFFPIATLIGTAIGAAAATFLLAAGGEGETLLPAWRERGIFLGVVGLGAAIGYAIDLNRRDAP